MFFCKSQPSHIISSHIMPPSQPYIMPQSQSSHIMPQSQLSHIMPQSQPSDIMPQKQPYHICHKVNHTTTATKSTIPHHATKSTILYHATKSTIPHPATNNLHAVLNGMEILPWMLLTATIKPLFLDNICGNNAENRININAKF